MQGNVLSCYPVILPSQVILPSNVTSVSTFHMQGNILSGFPAMLPLQVILPSGDVIVFSAVAVVRVRSIKTIVALVQG